MEKMSPGGCAGPDGLRHLGRRNGLRAHWRVVWARSEAFAQPAGVRAHPGRLMAQRARSAIEARLRRRQICLLATVSESTPVGATGASIGQKSAGLP